MHNPVDWYPWGEAAFKKARDEGKPILLSIGYSTCHWCHVMERESFEDEAVGEFLKKHFVAIKLDREERPDVDKIYMTAVQAMGQGGGWPLNVFLTPDLKPFYGGTYFPPQPKFGRPSFLQLLGRISELWVEKRKDITESAGQIADQLKSLGEHEANKDAVLAPVVVTNALKRLVTEYDPRHGGFGRAPKFPRPSQPAFVLRAAVRQGDEASIKAVLHTCERMAAGGMYDQLGGGFARYSVDEKWLVPHFEKMLYDQALLARVYLHAWQLTEEPRFLQTLEETINYVLRDLRDPLGGFYSAEDADSEGIEGKFYVWSIDEILEVCGEDASAVIDWYGVTQSGNWEHRNILERVTRGDLNRPEAVERGRKALYEARSKRIRPGLDDKVLTEWNALMLSTIAEAAAATGNAEWLDASVANANFLCDNLRVNGRWMRSWQGEARVLAFSADYAALVDAFVRLHEATGDPRWLDEASVTADALLDLFADPDDFGVFTNGSDGDQLVARPK